MNLSPVVWYDTRSPHPLLKVSSTVMQWLASKLAIPNTRKDNTLILYDLCLGVKNRAVPQVTSLWAPLTTMGNNSNTTQQQQSTLGISGSWHYIYKEDMKWHRGLSWWKYVAITGDQTYLEAFFVSLSTNKYNKVHAYISYDHCNSNHERKQLPTVPYDLDIRRWLTCTSSLSSSAKLKCSLICLVTFIPICAWS